MLENRLYWSITKIEFARIFKNTPFSLRELRSEAQEDDDAHTGDIPTAAYTTTV